MQIGLDRHTRTLNLKTFSTLRNTEGVDVDMDKSCVFVMLHFFVLDAILSNSCRMGNFRSIQVLYRQKKIIQWPPALDLLLFCCTILLRSIILFVVAVLKSAKEKCILYTAYIFFSRAVQNFT